MKREGYVYLGDVPTRIVTWGKWIEDPFTDEESKELILCIPGNPGVTQFYEPFLQTVYDAVRRPIWIVGHSGHEKPHDLEKYKIPDPKKSGNQFCLKTQINYKVTFIERYIPDDVKIYLLGHSVGCYTILYLLEYPTIKRRVIRSYLLFPTIEYVGDSWNGKVMTRVIKPIVPIIIFLSWIYTVLPACVQKVLLYIVCKTLSFEMHHFDAIIDFVDPYVLTNVFHMAYDQLKDVRERPNEKLKKNLENIRLYYGKMDGWVPNSVPYQIKTDIPELNMEVCPKGICHTFVIWQSKQMGEIVGKWLAALY